MRFLFLYRPADSARAFTESKELVAGFAIMKLNSKEEAIEEARKFLAIAGDGVSEIRLLHEESALAPPSAPGR